MFLSFDSDTDERPFDSFDIQFDCARHTWYIAQRASIVKLKLRTDH